MKIQLDFDAVVVESRQLLTTEFINKIKYPKDASQINELLQKSSKLAMTFQDNQTEEDGNSS